MVLVGYGNNYLWWRNKNTERKDRKTAKDFKERRRAEEDLWELTSQGGTNFELGSSQGDIFIEFQ